MTTRRVCVLDEHFREDLEFWIATDRKTALCVLRLMGAVLRDPFAGIGKPEPLRHMFAGAWSRRITEEHRLVYKVQDDALWIAQARYHY